MIITIIFFNPLIINAYSPYIYAGGESIGIELKSDYILVVGSYEINGIKPKLKKGDKIIKIDDIKVNNIKELTQNIQKKSNVKIGFIRDNKYHEENIKISYDDEIYKTGLYVKDEIMGIGTLTYIDPLTNIFGSLGHEINEKITKKLFEANSGTIFSSVVSKIVKSKNGTPGEKIARFNYDDIYGNITKNTKIGIYGNFKADLVNKKLYKVANESELKLGKAYILTTIESDKIEKFEINIIKLSHKSDNHDILFEITDSNLLKITNGIIQGMSGSPIIQDDKIIGAVTHVVVDNPIKGYGIYIGKMLTEGEN